MSFQWRSSNNKRRRVHLLEDASSSSSDEGASHQSLTPITTTTTTTTSSSAARLGFNPSTKSPPHTFIQFQRPADADVASIAAAAAPSPPQPDSPPQASSPTPSPPVISPAAASTTPLPSPLTSFFTLPLLPSTLAYLSSLHITTPTPIQAQAIPVALLNRDLIACAHTGSGKTLSFLLPVIIKCTSSPPSRDPLALLLGPSRELQRQTYTILTSLAPSLPALLAIGGSSRSEQLAQHRLRGTHVLVGTPGRVLDHLSSAVSPASIQMLVLDEGDRMLDEGMGDDVRAIVSLLPSTRQTLVYSATMPDAVLSFAKDSLTDPVVISIGRAGAANSLIAQDVQMVAHDEKFTTLLQALEKTAPPVLVFCLRNNDVDDVYEYLLIKGVRAAGIHGGLVQDERNAAIDAFKHGLCDILVASDVASKGLDFDNVAHVVCFDLPSVDAYVHRIGRTGRGGRRGMATTFIDKATDERELADLTALLREASQPIPHCLERFALQTATEGCSFCGGLGHRVQTCPRIQAAGRRHSAVQKEAMNEGY